MVFSSYVITSTSPEEVITFGSQNNLIKHTQINSNTEWHLEFIDTTE